MDLHSKIHGVRNLERSCGVEKKEHVEWHFMDRDRDDYVCDDASHLEHCLHTLHQTKRAGSQDGVRLPSEPLCPKIILPRPFLSP